MTRGEAIALGLSKYSGKPCKRGHAGLRYVGGSGCVECNKEKGATRSKRPGLIGKLSALRQEAIDAGSITYLGDPCSYGHAGRRYISSGGCIECHSRQRKQFYCDNTDSQIAYTIEHRKEKIKKNRELGRDKYLGKPCRYGHEGWRSADGCCIKCAKETRRLAAIRQREKRKKKGLTQKYLGKPCAQGHEGWRYSDGTCIGCHNEKRRQNYLRNKEQEKINVINRRAKKRNAGGTFTKKDVERMRKAQRGKCAYYSFCGTMLSTSCTVDHIVCLDNGGSNHPRNLQLACEFCNKSKGTKDPLEFARLRGLLL